MTVALPCSNCGRLYAAGHGALCGNCRPEGWHDGELRIPSFDPADAIPMNDAARKQRAKQGLPPHPKDLGPGTTPEDLVKRIFGP
jgi:hypothetical protein